MHIYGATSNSFTDSDKYTVTACRKRGSVGDTCDAPPDALLKRLGYTNQNVGWIRLFSGRRRSVPTGRPFCLF